MDLLMDSGRMRIAILHNQFSGGGGMEAYMLALIRGFLSAGDEVHIHTYAVDARLAERMKCTIHRQWLSFLPRRWKKYFFLYSCNRRFQRREYDLSLGLTRTFAPDIAVIGGIHPSSVAARPGSRHLLRRMHDHLETGFERTMFQEIPLIVAHSALLSREITHYCPEVEPDRISVVYPPIDTDFFGPVRGQALVDTQKKYHIDPGKMTLLFPSTGHRRKGLKELMTAFRHLDPGRFELLVAGAGLRGFTEIPENVRYLGYVENLSALDSAVDYTVLPSHYEPFGLAVVESLQCGTPVLVTRNVGAAELLTDQEAVLMEDNHPHTLVSAIQHLKRTVVAPGFVEQHDLSIPRHIEKLKSLVSCGAAGAYSG